MAPEDLDDGTARRIDDSRALCSACVSQERGGVKAPSSDAGLNITYMEDSGPDQKSPASTAEVNAPVSSNESRKSQRLSRGVSVPSTKPASGEFARKSTQQLPVARASSRAHPTQPPPQAGANKWIAFVGGAALVLVGAAVALMNSPSSDPAKTAAQNPPAEKPPADKTPANNATPNPSPLTPPAPVVVTPAPAAKDLPKDKNEREAFLLLEEAKVYHRTNMDDVYGYADKLEQLFNAYRATPAGEEAQKLLKAVQFPDGQSQLAPDSAWSGALNLMDLIDTKKDSVAGKWSRSGSSLTVESDKNARLQIPYEVPEEYDFKIVFKRLSGEEDVNQMVSARGKALMWSMAAGKNSWLGFECVQSKMAAGGPASVKQVKALENNRTYTSVVQVRKRVVRAFLDGKLVKEYRTDYGEFSMRNDWKLKNDRIPGLGAHSSKVVFEKVELRPVTGTGKKIR